MKRRICIMAAAVLMLSGCGHKDTPTGMIYFDEDHNIDAADSPAEESFYTEGMAYSVNTDNSWLLVDIDL